MAWDEFPASFRRKRRFPFFGDWFFGDVDEMMREWERMFEEVFKGEAAPRNLIRERRLPDGRVVKEMGPVVYGYSVTVGPDGKPVVREFGNVKPSLKTRFGGVTPSLDIRGEREPLIDVMSDNGNIKVVAELPGVSKPDIRLHATANTLTISVDTPERKYYKDLDLPAEVDPKSAKSTYKNGVLEVTLTKVAKRKPRGEPIEVE